MNKIFAALIAIILLFVFILAPTGYSQARMQSITTTTPSYHEAPELAAEVAQGLIPPVDQRLPTAPEVVQTVDSIGSYGGTWHDLEANWEPGVFMVINEPLIRWKPDYSGYEPGLAESYEWSSDGKTFTMHLRQGVRWSDGQPFTTADLQFWWLDIANNPNVQPGQGCTAGVPYYLLNSRGKPINITFPDDYTMVWTSDQPQWLAPFNLAQIDQSVQILCPAHYLKQFHPKYNSSATYDMLRSKSSSYNNPNFPTLTAWHLTTYESGIKMVYDRNPYYWKVDSQGDQLPYIDEVIFDTQMAKQDSSTRVAALSQGLYEASFRGSNDPNDIAVLTQNETTGNYHLQKGWMMGSGATPGWMINQDYTEKVVNNGVDTPQDVEIRALLRDPTFRRALSLAINRQDFITQVYGGIGTTKAWTISPQAYHFSTPAGQLVYQQWAQSYASYDQTTANSWLNTDPNLGPKDSNNCRTLPDASPFLLTFDYNGSDRVESTSANLLTQYFKAIGICVFSYDTNTYQGSDRVGDSNWMLHTWNVSELDLWTYPDWVFPVRGSRYFPMEGAWFASGGSSGWNPSDSTYGDPDAVALLSYWNQGVNESDPALRETIFQNAIQYQISHGPFVLAASGDVPVPVVVKNNFHNVPELGVLGPWAPNSPANLHPEQFWISTNDLSPMYTRMVPSQGNSDTATYAYIYGQQFSSGITAVFGTTDLHASLINSTTLQVTIPAGLASGTYDLTLTNPGVTAENYPKVYTVASPSNVDLQAYAYEFSATPAAPFANTTTQLSLIVYQVGGSTTLTNVAVNFYNGDPSSGGTLIGQGTVASLAPNSSASTSSVSWTPQTAGNYNLFAVIDPNNVVIETNKTNNTISRVLTVLPANTDQTPPVVDSFTVNNGVDTVNTPYVNLKATAEDPAPSSGLDAVLAVEFQYSVSSGQWIPGQDTGWVPYASMSAGYAWQLLPYPAVKYFKVWAKDKAGNVSATPYVMFVNYYPTLVNVDLGQSDIYRYTVQPGNTLTVTLNPVTGDPDLYIWNADNTPACHSINTGTAVDSCSVSVAASQAPSIFQVEIYGYLAASYVLQISQGLTPTLGPASPQQVLSPNNKTVQQNPVVYVSSVPVNPYVLPSSYLFHYIFLPLTKK